MYRYVILNKPYKVLTQFTDSGDKETLASYIDIPDIYGAGRLDYDSEGLLLLTDDGSLIHHLMNPKFKVYKTYFVQVEGKPSETDLESMRTGLELKDGLTKHCFADIIPEPEWLWPRNPPIRERKNIPTSWLKISICEGKNRQVRRMTAAIGCPTLRLIRKSIGDLELTELASGAFSELSAEELFCKLGIKKEDLKKKPGRQGRPGLKSSNGKPKRSDLHPRRNRPNRSRNRTGDKTRSGNRQNR